MSYCRVQEELDLEFFEYLLDYIYETENFSKYIPNVQIKRFQAIKNIAEILEEFGESELAKKYEDQLQKEIAEKEECILDWEKCRYSEIAVRDWASELEKLK